MGSPHQPGLSGRGLVAAGPRTHYPGSGEGDRGRTDPLGALGRELVAVDAVLAGDPAGRIDLEGRARRGRPEADVAGGRLRTLGDQVAAVAGGGDAGGDSQ